jgi:hypothetical protein
MAGGACKPASQLFEHEVARRWWALPNGCSLPLAKGGAYRLIFAGRPGGGAGPDVHDVVLVDISYSNGSDQEKIVVEHRIVGDVEFHIRSSDWFHHQHDSDPRYNGVVLHVVLICDDVRPTRRQDGEIVPVCSLYDLPLTLFDIPFLMTGTWLCQHTLRQADALFLPRVLRQAGILRFEQKAQAFVEWWHLAGSDGEMRNYDNCLVPALAEALGYGRDRAFFRAAGLYIMGLAHDVPEPLGRALNPTSLDAKRLGVLARLVSRWREQGIWMTLQGLLGGVDGDGKTRLDVLRMAFEQLGLSRARADILLCNVVLPFSLAIAWIEKNEALACLAMALYEAHPGLPSNQITRMMCQQLGLVEEPTGSCQQQGLHYIYQQTCRSKRCNMCIVGRRNV